MRSAAPARRILDLGGTALGSDQGAMVLMGYPYAFDELVVVDLPPDDRNELYKEDSRAPRHADRAGPVQYRYHSMADLTPYPDGRSTSSTSGRASSTCRWRRPTRVLAEAARILRPGGYLALDTPNARVCRIQQPSTSTPTTTTSTRTARWSRSCTRAGFEICEAKGLNPPSRSVAKERSRSGEVATDRGLFADIERCYLLSYLCRTPGALAVVHDPGPATTPAHDDD